MSLFGNNPGFVSAGLGGLVYGSNAYYFPVLPGWTVSSNTFSTGNVYYTPFVFKKTTTVVKICVENTGAGDSGKKFRAGLFSSDGVKPTTLLVQGSEATLAGSAAINEVTVASTIVYPNTLYFVGINQNGADYRNAATPTGFQLSIDYGLTETTFATPGHAGAFAEAIAYGALTNAVAPVASTLPIIGAIKVTP